MIRLLLVDDQHLIRQGLKALLELEPDLEIVGEAENGSQFKW
jgi:YesN/AraC family two-component response regulator